VPEWRDQQEQADRVGYEPGHADQNPTGEHDHTVEHFSTGNLTLSESVLGTGENPKPHPPDQKWTQDAHSDQEEHRPRKPDVLPDRHEGEHLSDKERARS
jgi:hypothetical protein